ncbi:hypothetical protein PIROE2DRAFT_59450 [Piromyces sp. E2]|nr:hypothetical protein PIROE2DRAFT_59450 [Piromyces sp. E2]|eukprot:OUM66349.1 hypothetical protein PIROE2DRAFT_59450 [Piromyces sp. E2]
MKYRYSDCIEQYDILNIKILELMIKKDLKPLVIFFGNKNRWLKRKEVVDNEKEKKGKHIIDEENAITTEYLNSLKDQLEEKINNFIDKKLAENYFIFNKKTGNTYFIEYALSYFPYPYVVHQLMEHYISIIPKNVHKSKGEKKNLFKEKVLLNSIKSSSNISYKDGNDYNIWKGSLDNTYSLNSGPIDNQRENFRKKERLYRGRSMINPSTQLITEEEEDNENIGMSEINMNEVRKETNRIFSIFEDNENFVSPFLRSNFYEVKLWQSETEMYDENKNKNVIPILDSKFQHSHSLENVQNLRNSKNESLLGLAFKKNYHYQ